MRFQNRDDFWSDEEGGFFDVKERTGKRVQRGVEEETTGGGRLLVQEWREKMEGKSGGFGEGCGGNGVCERPGGEGEVRRLEGDVEKKEGTSGGGGVGQERRDPLLKRERSNRLLKRRQVVLESGLEEAENEGLREGWCESAFLVMREVGDAYESHEWRGSDVAQKCFQRVKSRCVGQCGWWMRDDMRQEGGR